MPIIHYDSNNGNGGLADLAKIDSTTEAEIAMQIAEDDAEAAEDAAVGINLTNQDAKDCH